MARSIASLSSHPDSDANLRSIVDWLKSYKVPIEFVPFTIYADIQGGPRFLQFEGVVTSQNKQHMTTRGPDIGYSIRTKLMRRGPMNACFEITSQQSMGIRTALQIWKVLRLTIRYLPMSISKAYERLELCKTQR